MTFSGACQIGRFSSRHLDKEPGVDFSNISQHIGELFLSRFGFGRGWSRPVLTAQSSSYNCYRFRPKTVAAKLFKIPLLPGQALIGTGRSAGRWDVVKGSRVLGIGVSI